MQSELQACVLLADEAWRLLNAICMALRRKRQQSATGQQAVCLEPMVHLLTVDAAGVPGGEGDAQRVDDVTPAHRALCSTPAGAAEHLRGLRRAVMLARGHAV